MSNENETVEEVVETPAAEAPDADQQAAEQEASATGWRPKAEFRGDPTKWVDAKEFIRRGKDHLPIKVARLEKQLETAGRTVEELREANKKFGEFTEQARERERKEFQRQLDEARADKRRAAEAGDTKAMLAADDRIDVARERLAETPAADPTAGKPQKPAEPPEVTDFYERNPQVENDKALHIFANSHVRSLMAEDPALRLPEALRLTEEAMRRAHPAKFGNPRRDAPGAVEGGGAPAGSGQRTGKRTYNDLPADAKRACDNLVKNMPGYKRENYLADYPWPQ